MYSRKGAPVLGDTSSCASPSTFGEQDVEWIQEENRLYLFGCFLGEGLGMFVLFWCFLFCFPNKTGGCP